MGKFVDIEPIIVHHYIDVWLHPGDVIKVTKDLGRRSDVPNDLYGWHTIIRQGEQALIISVSRSELSQFPHAQFETCLIISNHRVFSVDHWYLGNNCTILYRGN